MILKIQKKKTIKKMITNYNSGFEKSSHSNEYLRRFMIVYEELKKEKVLNG